MPTAIAGVGPTNTTVSSDAPRGSNKLGRNEFLKLLTAQLANQDPLAPTDNQAFIAQLATFSQLEAQQTTNGTLEQLLLAQAANNQTTTATLVGKDITYKSNELQFDGATEVPIYGELSAKAMTVTATIVDSNGKTVRTIRDSAHDKGPVSLSWDGRDESGTLLPAGKYTVRLVAADQFDKSVDIQSQGHAIATGVSFTAGFAELILNGARVRLTDVVEIKQPTTTTNQPQPIGS